MHRFRTWTARRWLALSAGCAVLALLIVFGAQRAMQDAAQVPLSPPPLPYGGRLVPEGYQWGDPHPWLRPVLFKYDRRYIGPQTAEAIFAVMDSGRPRYQQNKEDAAKLLEHYRYVLSRGAVIRDKLDAHSLGGGKLNTMNHLRNDPDFAARMRKAHGLPADATLQELMDAEIDSWIKSWTSMRE